MTSSFLITDNETGTMASDTTNLKPVDDIPTDLFDTLNHQKAMARLPTIMYLVILMVMGLVGNAIVLYVYYQKFKPSTTRTFVLAMSVFDIGSNIVAIPNELYDLHSKFTFNNRGLCRTMRFCNMFLSLVSGLILVVVALDRFRKICRPLNKQHSLRRTTVSIVMCAGVSVVLTIPFTVLNGRQTVGTGVGNITGFMCSIDDDFVHTTYPVVYFVVLYLIFIVSITIMIVSYARIARQLWRHRKTTDAVRKGSDVKASCSAGDHKQGSSDKETMSDDKDGSDSIEMRDVSADAGAASNHDASTAKDEASSSSGDPPVDKIPEAGCRGVGTVGGGSDPGTRGDECALVETQVVDQLKNSSDASGEQKKAPDTKTSNENTSPAHVSSKQGNSLSRSVRKTPSMKHSFSRPTGPRSTRRDTQSSVKNIPTSTTLMMFILTAIFIINFLPNLIVFTLRAALGNIEDKLTGFELNAYNIALRSYFINSAVNSIVYGFCSERFRRQCRKLFRRTIK